MTFEDWGEVLRIAATIWPQSRAFFDDPPDAERTPTRTWWAALCGFETDDVLTAIGRLGIASRFWPSLADVVEATRRVITERVERARKAEQIGRARLPAPRQGTPAERLVVFDHTSAVVRRDRMAELRRFAENAAGADVDADHLAAAVDDVGPWEQRLRELIAGDWPSACLPEPADERPGEESNAADRVASAASQQKSSSCSLGAIDTNGMRGAGGGGDHDGALAADELADDRKVWAARTSHSGSRRAAGVPRGHGRWRDDRTGEADDMPDVARLVPRSNGRPSARPAR